MSQEISDTNADNIIIVKRKVGNKPVQPNEFVHRTILAIPPVELEKMDEVCKLKGINRSRLIRMAIDHLLCTENEIIESKLFKVNTKNKYVKNKSICVCLSKSHFNILVDIKNNGVPSTKKTKNYNKKIRDNREYANFSQFILDALQGYYETCKIYFEYN